MTFVRPAILQTDDVVVTKVASRGEGDDRFDRRLLVGGVGVAFGLSLDQDLLVIMALVEGHLVSDVLHQVTVELHFSIVDEINLFDTVALLINYVGLDHGNRPQLVDHLRHELFLAVLEKSDVGEDDGVGFLDHLVSELLW